MDSIELTNEVKMKTLKINRIKYQNFKGLKDFELTPNGEDVTCWGQNAAGKTTLIDGYFWLLFSKDSSNRADFEVKTLNEDGSVKHNLNHSVEAEIQLLNETVRLRKVFKEKWTRKRGSATEEFSGHESQHFIDDIPVKKSEFEAKIAEIIDEKTFRLLTDIRHFNENLKWNERREILLSICGEGSDQQELEDASKQQKKIKAQLKEINDELQNIPVRIDETSRSMPDISNIDKKELVNKQSQIKDAIIKKQNDKRELESGGAVATKKKELAELQTAREEESRKGIHKVNEQLNKLDDQVQGKKNELRKVKDQVTSVEQSKERAEINLSATKRDIEAIQENIKKTKGLKFQPEATTCYACGQELPQGDVQQQEEQFNIHKAESLEELNNELKIKKGVIENYEAEIKEAESRIKELQKKADAIDKECKALQKKRYELNAKAEPSKKQLQLEKQIGKVEDETQSLQASNKDAIDKAYQNIRKLETDLEQVQEQLNQLKSAENAQKRIKELEAEEKRLAREYEKYQSQLYDIENLIKAKVTNLEEKINSYFQIARFKLFDVQINEGIKETCETVLNGIPYGSLSNSERIKVGIDIATTVQNHYGLKVPLFADNAESVVEIPKVDTQMFKLVVSGEHKELTVEVE